MTGSLVKSVIFGGAVSLSAMPDAAASYRCQ